MIQQVRLSGEYKSLSYSILFPWLRQLEGYFAEWVDSHSWSTVQIDRNGLQFFWKYVLQTDWQRAHICKAPKVATLPDIRTLNEVRRWILAMRQLRYWVFLLTTYSRQGCAWVEHWRYWSATLTLNAAIDPGCRNEGTLSNF
ncbi:MAG: hypothetical protein ACRERV_00625 [Methylococcales bacterium]